MKKIILISSLVFAAFLTGCGSENLSDSSNYKKDLERESAAISTKDYQQIAGIYTSPESSNPKAKTASSTTYNVTANFSVFNIVKDGSTVPQPSITGYFKIPQADLVEGAEDDGTIVTVPFSGGVYDPSSGNLAIRISGFTAQGANVSCKVDLPKITCTYIPIGSGTKFDFVLQKNG